MESNLSVQELSAKIESLQEQLVQMQGQLNHVSWLLFQLSPRAINGLNALGTLLYILLTPFRWFQSGFRILLALFRWFRRILGWMWRRLKSPSFYWAVFYWSCFAWVVILDGGVKEILRPLRHPIRLVKSLAGLLQ